MSTSSGAGASSGDAGPPLDVDAVTTGVAPASADAGTTGVAAAQSEKGVAAPVEDKEAPADATADEAAAAPDAKEAK